MTGLTIKTEDAFHKVAQAADKASFKNFGHAAASIAKDVRSTLENTAGPSSPGSPPHTHTRALLRAIQYDADKESAIIGPVASLVGDVGGGQEFGGEFRGQHYPARPFMGPGLERAIPRFAGDWSGSIGN